MNRNPDDAPRPPADVIRDGNLKATIWRNDAENGAFYATSFVRTFRDSEGQFHDTNSFVAADLLKLSELARKAYERTSTLRREDRAQARQQPEGGPEHSKREAFKQQRESATPRREPSRGR